MIRERTYAVVGLGGIGSAAAYWLARSAPNEVIGLEQFELGHGRGASEDHSRIIRLSYHTAWYVRMAREAYRAWATVEEEADERLVLRTGGLDLWPEGAAIPMTDYTDSLRAEGVPFEELDAAEIMRRWPEWRLDDATRGLYQAEGGIAAASLCNRAHLRMAREHGAALVPRSRVTRLEARDGEVELLAGGDRVRCELLVLAADAWTNALLAQLGMRLPLTITKEQVTYFEASNPEAFSPERFPIWIWMDEPCFYGMPVFGEAGPKAAQDVGGRVVDPDARTYEPDEEMLERVRSFLRLRLPGAAGPVLSTRTCLYTIPPDRDFVLDAVPGHPNVLVALGAAHGFKFASLFGRILSELAIHGRTEHDLSHFRIDRPLLRAENV